MTQGDKLFRLYREGNDPEDAKRKMAYYLCELVSPWLPRVGSSVRLEDVEELRYEIAWHIVARLDKFQQRSKFESWAKTITRRKVASWMRKEVGRRQRTISFDAPLGNGDDGDIRTLEDVIPDPRSVDDDTIERREMRELIIQQIPKIKKENYRTLLNDRYVRGLAIADILSERGISPEDRNSIEVILCRANKELVKKVQEIVGVERLDSVARP